ncbi:MAG: hypothetical protein ACK5JJ_03655 [Cyanobacteriota bacterium]|jgi:hypothetical protein
MAHALVFVAAPQAALPVDPVDWEALQQAHRLGIRSGLALRMFRVPDPWEGSLEQLVIHGQADLAGSDPFQALQDGSAVAVGNGPAPRHRICDAVVPHLDPRTLWLGVYEISGERLPNEGFRGPAGHPCRQIEILSTRCLDSFPLREAENETCWFYPTENGTYLCWENQRRLETLPGFLPDQGITEVSSPYRRSDLHVLWSLMADDQALTCVGLTYAGKRIEWTTSFSDPEPFATWTSFCVDTMADQSYRELENITVFQ